MYNLHPQNLHYVHCELYYILGTVITRMTELIHKYNQSDLSIVIIDVCAKTVQYMYISMCVNTKHILVSLHLVL